MNTTAPVKVSEPTLEISQALATANGLTLTTSRDGAYCLTGERWFIVLRPMRQEFYPSARAPRFELKPGWDLSDAVQAAIVACAKRNARKS